MSTTPEAPLMLWREPGNKAIERLMQHRKRLVAKGKERKDALKPWRRKYVMMALSMLGPLLWFPLVAKGIFTLPVALFTWLIFDPLVYYVWILIRLWLVKMDGKRTTDALRHGPYGASMWSADIEWRELENSLAMRSYNWRKIMYWDGVPALVCEYLRQTRAVRMRFHVLNDRKSHSTAADLIELRAHAERTADAIAERLGA